MIVMESQVASCCLELGLSSGLTRKIYGLRLHLHNHSSSALAYSGILVFSVLRVGSW